MPKSLIETILLERPLLKRAGLLGQVRSPDVSVRISAVPTARLTLTVDRTAAYIGDTLTFSGRFTQNDVAIADATVTLYRDTTRVETATTDSAGNYRIQWRADVVGTFSFHSEASTPARPAAPPLEIVPY